MSNLYEYIPDVYKNSDGTVISKQAAINEFRKRENVICSDDAVTEEQLGNIGIYPIKISKTDSSIANDVNNVKALNRHREYRNKLLQEVDWVEASSEVNEESKKRIAAYKHLLRNCLPDHPNLLYSITKPSITIYPYGYYDKNERIDIAKLKANLLALDPNDKDLQKAKTDFIKFWMLFEFTNDPSIVYSIFTCLSLREKLRRALYNCISNSIIKINSSEII